VWLTFRWQRARRDDAPVWSPRRELRLARRLDQLVATRTWPGKARIVRRHPELLGADAQRLLKAEPGEVHQLHAVLLRRARTVGPDRAVEEMRAAVEDLPRLVGDGVAALRRYRVNGAFVELAAAVEAFEAAVVLAVPGFPDRALALANLGLALRDRFEAYGEQADLRRAVDVLEEAVQLTTSAGMPDVSARRAALVNLGSVLLTSLAAGGPDANLRRALEVLTEADALPPGTDTEQAAVLNALGEAQLQCHLRWRRPSALDAAVAAITAAVPLVGTDSARARSNLGVVLSVRHLMTGNLRDLQQSVGLLVDAVDATPEHSPDLPARQANLGTALVERYHRLGDPHDLNVAIDMLDMAVAASRPGTPDAPAWRYNLALALGDRYERDGDLTDLDQAVAHLEAVVGATPLASTARPARLDQLAVTLRLRGLRREDPDELARAVTLHREAVRDGVVVAGERAMLLGNLAGTLRAWAAATGEARLLQEALNAYRAAATAAPPGDAAHAIALTNLGNGLVDHYDAHGQRGSLFEAIRLYDAAIAVTDLASPELPGRLYNRAGGLRRLHELDGQPAALQRAVADYRDGCWRAAGVVAEVGLRCGLSWGEWASRRRAWAEATEAFQFAADGAEQLVHRQLTRRDKQTWLRAIRTMPAAAAFALSQADALPLALVRLEWGRARLLADALDRDRADLDVLAQTHPQLAERFRLAAGRVVVAEATTLG
jgi:hypothetical protein